MKSNSQRLAWINFKQFGTFKNSVKISALTEPPSISVSLHQKYRGRLRPLRNTFGVTLVERTTRQVRLTETGTLYRDEITPALRSLSAADDLVAEHSQEASGTIRITFPPGYGELRLFKVLEKFRAHYPKVVCDMELSDNYLDLSSGEIDVALRFTHSPPEYLVAKRLHSNRFILVASPNYLDEHGRPHMELSRYAALAYRCHQGIMEWHMQSPDGSV